LLPNENWDARIQHERSKQGIPTEFETLKDKQVTKKKKKKWYKPPKRERPAFHPIEWFFWIGWTFYVFFGFIWVGLKFILREIGYYFLWCCYWGPPRDIKRRDE
jgi:hypothetical protein